MALEDLIRSKANALAVTQATALSAEISASLLVYQTTLVTQMQGLGITLNTPIAFTDPSTISNWILPILQQAFSEAIINAVQSNLSKSGFI